MSKTVDERVVSMRFDNKHFESNVRTTMSTLDRLKEKLHLKGASKGLENVDAAAKKVDMSGVGTGVDTLKAKFSALDVMAVTALANITNSAVNTGKRIISALTIDPIKTGLSEYETQINAVQTILANTQSKGTTIDDVNKALDELNAYADKTIYNFTEMTRNIGTFTAAGVDLDTSVSAIQGIANLAAVSGSTSQQASTAMYQLSQALATGTVKLMDWNSVVNAGMGGEVFQNALIRTAATMAGASEDVEAWRAANIDAHGSFRDSLTSGAWLTTDVLTATLEQFTMCAEEGTEEWEKYKASLREQGYTEAQAEEILKMANTATDAATKVKTFTQLWDVLKESAQSGWSQTWEIIIGDFEEAKALFSPLADFLTGIIGSISDVRNKILEGAFGRGITGLADKVRDLLKPATQAVEAVQETVDVITDLGDVVNRVIRGEFGNGAERFNALTAAGYNWCEVQNEVNKELGDSYRYTEKQIAIQNELLGVQQANTEAQSESAEVQSKLTEEEIKRIDTLSKMSDEELRSLGYTEEQIAAFNELRATADKLGLSVEGLLTNIDDINGRWLLIDSFKNVGKGLVAIGNAVKDAWANVFPTSIEEQSERLFNLIAGIHRLSNHFIVGDETAQKLTKTFEGLFAIIDVIATITGGVFRIGFEIVKDVLSYFNMDVLDLTASISEAIIGFRDWLDSVLDFSGVIDKIAPYISKAVSSFKEWIATLKDSENLPRDIANGIINSFSYFGGTIKRIIGEAISSLVGGFSGAPVDMISGFVNGVWEGIQIVGQVIMELANTALAKFREVLGIHSPSTETHSDGVNFMMGFWNGLKSFASTIWEYIKSFGAGCLSALGALNINIGKIFAAALSVGMTMILVKVGRLLSAIASPLEGFADILDNTSDFIRQGTKTLKAFKGVLRSIQMQIAAKALKEIALAILILVGAIAILTLLDTKKMLIAVGAIAALMIVMKVLLDGITKMGKGAEKKISNFALMLLAMAGAMLLLSIVAKRIANMSWEELGKAGAGIAVLTGIIVALIAASNLASKNMKTVLALSKMGTTIYKIAGAMLMLALVAKIMASMSWEEMGRAGAGLAGLAAIVTGLIAATKLAGKDIDKVGPTIFRIGAALLILAIVAKIIAGMSWADMGKAAVGLAALGGLITGLIAATKLINKDMKTVMGISKLGSMMLKIAAGMLLLTFAAKIIAGMSWADMGKAGAGLVALAGIMVGLMAATRLAGEKELKRVGSTILLMSVSMAILAGVAIILSLIDLGGLAKGIVAIGMLGGIMALMIAATKNAKNCKENLIIMTIAIGVMAAAIAALSFIDITSLSAATLAMSAVMGMFAVLIQTSGKAGKSIGTLIVMTVAIGLIAYIIYRLAELPVDATLGSAAALSMLLLAVSGSLAILSTFASSAKNSLLGVLALTAMVVPLFAFIWVLSVMQNIQNATTNATLLCTMATVLTLLLIPLSIIGALVAATGGIILLGVVALTAMVVPLFAFIAVLAVMQNIENATANADLLIGFTKTMVDMLVQLSIIAPLAILGVASVGALTGLIIAIGALAVGVGALMEKFPQLQSFLNEGLPVLEQIAGSIGTIVGKLVAGFAGEIMQLLPQLGICLSQFMMGATPFITGAKMVDESVLTGVGILSGAILALTAAELINGVASILSFGTSFATLGTELSKFIINAMPFIMASRLIDPAIMEGVKTLAETILILTGSDLLESLTGWITGGTSFADFGSQLAEFAPYMKTYADTVAGIDAEAVTASANAAKSLAEMAEILPNLGGVAAFFAGDNDMATFGTQLQSFGSSLKIYADTVNGINAESIASSVTAGKELAGMASDIPNLGGVVSWFTGDNDLTTFGTQIVAFGASLMAYADTVAGIDAEAISTSVTAGSELGAMAADIPNIGGVVSWFTGDNDLATFGTQIVTFGSALSAYSQSVVDIETSAIGNSVDAANELVDLTEAAKDATSWDLGKAEIVKFGESINAFGESMSSYSDTVGDLNISAMSSSTSQFIRIANMVKGLDGVDFGSLSSFSSALGDIGDSGVDAFITAFEGAYDRANSAGKSFVSKLEAGIKSKVGAVKAAVSSMASAAASAIKTRYSSFYNAGMYCVQGFANGISANTFLATAKARAMADAAIQAAKSKLQQNSPSKVFKYIGMGVPEGFALGIGMLGNEVKSAAVGMTNTALDGTRHAMSAIASVLDADLDYNPTITPVLDLGELSTGVTTMNRLLNANPSVTMSSNLRAISNGMAGRQNGGNDDVISAIKDLGNKLGNTSGDVININGVTYDDGSNITSTVKSLVRAIRVERRR